MMSLCKTIAIRVIAKPSWRVARAVFLMLDHRGHFVSCCPVTTVLSVSELQKESLQFSNLTEFGIQNLLSLVTFNEELCFLLEKVGKFANIRHPRQKYL